MRPVGVLPFGGAERGADVGPGDSMLVAVVARGGMIFALDGIVGDLGSVCGCEMACEMSSTEWTANGTGLAEIDPRALGRVLTVGSGELGFSGEEGDVVEVVPSNFLRGERTDCTVPAGPTRRASDES